MILHENNNIHQGQDKIRVSGRLTDPKLIFFLYEYA